MKKLFSYAALAMLALSLNSCSDDDAATTNNNTSDNVLLKKIITTQDGTTTTYNVEYNGNKILKSVGTDGSLDEYTYTGNLITQKITTGSPEIDGYTEKLLLTYDANGKLTASLIQLISLENADESYATKYVYTYNTDNTITVKTYEGDLTTQTELSDTATVKMINGNLISYESEGNGFYDISTFDNKNNPLKNITGYDAINLAYLDGGVNNQVKIEFGPASSNSNYTQTTTNFTYTYNSSNYPVTSTWSMTTGESSSTQYFYE